MVVLQVKRGDENQFLFQASSKYTMENIIRDISAIFNGRLKIFRICAEIEDLALHGIILPPEIMGLTDEQVIDLKLTDPWADKCIPSGGFDINPDEVGRRNGRQPKPKMQEVLTNAVKDAKQLVDKKLIQSDKAITLKSIEESMNILKGSVTIVYPMGLPPHEPIKMEFTNTEDLSGTQASKEVIEPTKAQLWFAGHQMLPEKQLLDYSGKNERSKLVVKLNEKGEGPPGREPSITEQTKQMLMSQAFKRQEELKKLELDDDDSYLNSKWSDNGSFKRQVHGLENVKFRY